MFARVSIVSALAGCAASFSAYAQDGAAGNAADIDSVVAPSGAPPAAPAAPQPAAPDVDASTAAATPKPHAGGGSRLVEEIVVTAQKREENLQDVPISLQAFSGANLDARGVTNPTDLQRITPGLTITQAVGFTLIYLRGVGSDAFLLGDPSVAYYVDNIYFPFAQGLAQEFGGIDRVEVLKGPQGTLFGRNAVGGAVNVLTSNPKLGERTVQIESNFGNYSEFDNRINANIPIGRDAALLVSAFYNTRNFYQDGTIGKNPLDPTSVGEKLDPIISKAARVKLRWKPIEDMDLTLAGVRYISQGAGTLFQLNEHPSLLARLLGVQPQNGYDGALDSQTYQTIDNRVIYGDGKYSTPWLDLRVLGSHQLIATGATYDYDGSPMPLVSFMGKRLFDDVTTGELQFISNQSSPDWLKWIIGGYYFKNSAGYDGGLRQQVQEVHNLVQGLQQLVPPSLIPPGLSALLPNGDLYAFGELGTNSRSAYGQATATITPWLSFTLGGRFTSEQRYVIEAYNALGTMDQGAGPPIFPLDPSSNLKSYTTKSFTPKVSVEFHLPHETLAYLSYQEAVKSATFNPLKDLQPVDYVPPEKTKAYEIGLKSSLFDGALTFSGAAFFYDISHLQVQFVSLLNGGVVTYQSANRAQVKGLDFDVSALLFPNHVDDLALTAGAAFINAKYTDFGNGSGFDETTGVFSTNNNFTGNEITRSPRFTGNLTLSKTWAVPGGPLELASDYYYNSGFYYTAQNSPVATQPAYGLLGAHLSYLYQPWRLRATVYGNNILDKQYTIGELQADFGTNVSLGPPVTYGMRMQWDF